MRFFATLRIAPCASWGSERPKRIWDGVRVPLGLGILWVYSRSELKKVRESLWGALRSTFWGPSEQLMALPGRVYESWRDSIFESFPRGTGPLGISLETEFRLGWRGCLSAWLLFALPAGLVRCQRRNGPPVRSRPAGFLSLTPGPFPSSAGMNSMPADSRAV